MRLPNQARPTGKIFLWLSDGIKRNILRMPHWS